ncbi:CAP domain-containing protein [Flavivirga spongiicola]|uniref:CAP domain-containing protein n=1 Tax=Flavivirga spongiicola TaxID=421621 RepID=A0ABU7XTL6_9FLAO|nr:CAP domain-containing protein [Flavivirga sp. MEBiC05379]MDO5979135.1 CAP domain-containing protein [Flavivirga sp. MEBiC05379]
MKNFLLRTGLVLAFFSVLTCNIACSKDDSAADIEKEMAADIATSILQLVNEHRSGIGKQILETNTLAENLAEAHNLHMISQQKISHENFDYRADRLFDEEKAKGVGENVAAKQKSAQDVMAAWLDSKGHRKNIEGDFTHIGISAIKNKEGHYYYTQLFLKK